MPETTPGPTASDAERPHGARRRRLVSVSAAFLLWMLLLALSPFLAVVAVAADLVTAPRRTPSLRALGFALAYATIEVGGVLAAGALWVRYLGGRIGGEAWIDSHLRLQAWWMTALFRAARPLLGLRVEVDGEEALDEAPLLVFGRHVSLVDSLVSAVLLGRRRYELRYVLKQELQFDPSLDIVGHRLRNHFVDRHSGDAAEIEAVGRLGDELRPDTAVVIFPEGTRFSPAKRDRALERLRSRDDGGDLLPLAERLRHLLPPRPGGALSLLDHAPDADVVIFGHVGFEGLNDFRGLWRAVPFRLPVEVKAWRHRRETLPVEAKDRARWIFERWIEMDDWIDGRLAERSGGS